MAHKWQAMSFWRSPKENQAACKQQQRQQRAPHKRRLWVKGGRGMPTGGAAEGRACGTTPLRAKALKTSHTRKRHQSCRREVERVLGDTQMRSKK